MRCQNVKVCGIVKVSSPATDAILNEILAELKGPLVVDPSAAWEAVFTNALNAAEISLDAETLAALEEITVTVDTTNGPVEITGTVQIDDAGGLDVNVLNTPLDTVVTNWDELFAGTLNVTLNGEEVNVTLNAEQLAAIIADDDTDDDKRPVAIHCFHWEDGDTTGTFLGWANANEDGTFGGYTVISGIAPPETSTVTCDEMSVTSIQGVKLEPLCVDTGDGPVWATPVSMIDTATGAVTVVSFLDEMGQSLGTEAKRVADCDCPQPECCEDSDGAAIPQQSVTFKSAGISGINTSAGQALTSGPYDFVVNDNSAPDMPAANADLQAFLDANGGGTGVIEYTSESVITITITNSPVTFIDATDDSNPGPHAF